MPNLVLMIFSLIFNTSPPTVCLLIRCTCNTTSSGCLEQNDLDNFLSYQKLSPKSTKSDCQQYFKERLTLLRKKPTIFMKTEKTECGNSGAHCPYWDIWGRYCIQVIILDIMTIQKASLHKHIYFKSSADEKVRKQAIYINHVCCSKIQAVAIHMVWSNFVI